MLLSHTQIKELKKPELLQYALSVTDIQTKLEEIVGTKLEEFVKNLSERFEANEREFNEKLDIFKQNTKTRFEKLEGEILVVKNANRLLAAEVEKDRVSTQKQQVEIEREAFRTAEYTQYETLEFSKIPLTIPDDEVQDVILKIVNSLHGNDCADIVSDDLQACHRRQGKYTKESVLCKFVWRPHAFGVLSRKKGLKDLVLQEIDSRLTSAVYINENLSPYYGKLRYMCKRLWEAKLLSKFWVSGHKVKAIISEGSDIKIITHAADFAEIYSGRDLSTIFRGIK